jgi:hypothetical protein
MFEYLTHCYNRVPFRSISGLSKSEAVKVMEDLCDDSPFFERFKEPLKYWEDRQEAEAWLRAEFIKKGGKPKGYYPYYCILGPASSILDRTICSIQWFIYRYASNASVYF